MQQRFRYSIFHPLKPDAIERREVEEKKIIEIFENFPWEKLLAQMKDVPDEEIHYAPSLEIENIYTQYSITVIVVGEESEYDFWLFYKRPKRVKTFFGLKEKLEANFTSDITDQTHEDARKIIQALFEDDINYLEEKIK